MSNPEPYILPESYRNTTRFDPYARHLLAHRFTHGYLPTGLSRFFRWLSGRKMVVVKVGVAKADGGYTSTSATLYNPPCKPIHFTILNGKWIKS